MHPNTATDLFAGIWTCNECSGRYAEEFMFQRGLNNTGQCRDCRRYYRRTWYEKNASAAKEYSTRWKRANPQRWLDSQRKFKYGIPHGTYVKMLSEQGNGCDICGSPEPATKSLHVDHDHSTGVIRSLLCDTCNRGLGYFKDDPSTLEAAAAYLRKWGKK